MTIKITTPNGGADSLDFGCARTAIAATVTGTEVSSGEGKLELKTTTGGTSAAKMTIAANGTVTLATPLPVASGGTGTTTGGLGVGQSWSDVSGSRSANTTYTNSTGKPIQVNVWGGGGNGLVVSLTVGSVLVGLVGGNGDVGSHKVIVSAIVPAGATYIAQNNGNSLGWAELR
jgi:hypothetical protein